MENRYLLNLFTLEKSLVYYLNAINSNGMVIEKIRHNAAKIGFSQESLELLDDIIIENDQCLKQAEIYSNILTGLMDARGSIVSNNLNVLMKTLNIITVGDHGADLRRQRLLDERRPSRWPSIPWPSGSSWAWPRRRSSASGSWGS